MKNCGIGNGITDASGVRIDVEAADRIVLHHGWTDMGQGVDTVARQMLCEAAGLEDPALITVRVCTTSEVAAGMTTASRASMLLGNAILDAARQLRTDLADRPLAALAGRSYHGHDACDWTAAADGQTPVVSHMAYGYATHLVILDDAGGVATVVAAHDGGRIINPTLFEGQIEGAVAMGLGYALTESLPLAQGQLTSTRMSRLGLFKAGDMPRIIVKGVEVPDPVGPFGAKGVGEIGLVPTAAAVANALYRFDGRRRCQLPLQPRSKP